MSDFQFDQMMIKDPVLDKFLEKALELEQAVGPPPAPKEIVKQMTLQE